jgi:hypothetical protein
MLMDCPFWLGPVVRRSSTYDRRANQNSSAHRSRQARGDGAATSPTHPRESLERIKQHNRRVPGVADDRAEEQVTLAVLILMNQIYDGPPIDRPPGWPGARVCQRCWITGCFDRLRRASLEAPWLFASNRPGRHVDPQVVMHRLRRLGINLLSSRNTAPARTRFPVSGRVQSS